MCHYYDVTTTTMATTTTSGNNPGGDCDANYDVLPYPGDCHKYYMCILNDSGDYDVEVIFLNITVYFSWELG